MEVIRVAKPRTNADAAAFWAASAHMPELPDAVSANSVGIRNQAVFVKGERRYWRTEVTSFGWYPMGVIVRRASSDMNYVGPVLRIITNSDGYPRRGWADTPGDQANVDHEARCLGRELGIEVERLPLTGHGKQVQVRPREDDPEPTFDRTEVPIYFFARDPGEEPVKSEHGCIAGRVETYEVQVNAFIHAEVELGAQDQAYVVGGYLAPPPGAFTYLTESGKQLRARTAEMHTRVWGTEQHRYQVERNGKFPASAEYIECPHCAEHRAAHYRWSERMHSNWSSPRNYRGWLTYEALMHKYGSEGAWREARRDYVRAKRAYHAEHRAWTARNFISHEAVSKDRHGLPHLPDGYAMRKDAESHFRRQRAAQRAEQRRQREHEARERHARQVERFRRGIQRQRRKGFLTLAQEVAQNLANVSCELQSTDTKEPSA